MSNMIDLFNKFIGSFEGMEYSMKINGKESEIHIKGDFMAMIKVLAEAQVKIYEDSKNSLRIIELESEIAKLKCK